MRKRTTDKERQKGDNNEKEKEGLTGAGREKKGAKRGVTKRMNGGRLIESKGQKSGGPGIEAKQQK